MAQGELAQSMQLAPASETDEPHTAACALTSGHDPSTICHLCKHYGDQSSVELTVSLPDSVASSTD